MKPKRKYPFLITTSSPPFLRTFQSFFCSMFYLLALARVPGLEPGTSDLGGLCSIQLSYTRFIPNIFSIVLNGIGIKSVFSQEMLIYWIPFCIENIGPLL